MLEFSLKTWNCFGLPQGLLAILRASGPPSAHRLDHPELHAAVASPEIVCVQELWLRHSIRLFEKLPHPHKLRDSSGLSLGPPSLVGTGLGVASRFAIVASTLRHFAPPHAGADRLARKGMLHLRLLLGEAPRVELDLIDTHLQAQRGLEPQRVRARQMRELAALIAETGSPERPFLLCGDLNLNGLGGMRAHEYDALLRLLDGFCDLGAAADLPTFQPHKNLLAGRFFAKEPEQRLDYVFFRPARRGPRIEPLSLALALAEPLAANGEGPSTYASDHYALVARFRLGESSRASGHVPLLEEL